ncbi:MAG: Gfo/Idh/MocA family oxidoreductase [Nitrospiraceae bacterium]|nr:Gfo/Idh/MocA family oxidoreductase [Nitrospiraceae bacterium]
MKERKNNESRRLDGQASVSESGVEESRTKGHGPSRRDFLVSTASLSAGLILAGKATGQEAAAATGAEGAAASATAASPTAPLAPPPAIKRKGPGEVLNIALIGQGAQGQVLRESILRIPNIRVKAICDIWKYAQRRSSRTLKKYGIEVTVYEDYKELIENEKDLDAAVIATPDFVHADHAIACMEAGLDVYCEKEMSNSLARARDMVLASRATGRLLQIGHQRRSNPRYRHAINTLVRETNLLGRVTHGYAQWNRAKSDDLGWPKKYEISPEKLEKYGYSSMSHFRNWRWYKKYGGGPIVDLGSHQIDIFAWLWGTNPKSVMASGGVDFYPHHEWYDNVLATFEYENEQGVNRAFYQVLTTTSCGGFFERFMGVDGTLVISEVPQRGDHMLREANAQEWEPFANKGLLLPQVTEAPKPAAKTADVSVDVRVSPTLGSWQLPVQLFKPAHQPHLENFFNAIRMGTPLNCPGEVGYETAVAVLACNTAVEAGKKIEFTPEDFEV